MHYTETIPTSVPTEKGEPMKLELFDDDGNYIPNPSEPMKNKEWLATLSAEDFYKEFKRASSSVQSADGSVTTLTLVIVSSNTVRTVEWNWRKKRDEKDHV